MDKKTEALKLALVVLKEVQSETFRLMRNGQKLYAEEKVWNAVTAIKEALMSQSDGAQPEQFPFEQLEEELTKIAELQDRIRLLEKQLSAQPAQQQEPVVVRDKDNVCYQYTYLPQHKQEPFGYFKPEPFGWTDCAETDEGAIALYEKPQPCPTCESLARTVMMDQSSTDQPQRKPLTDEQKKALFKEWADARGVWPRLTHEEIFYAGIEAANGIKEKNT